MHLRNIESLTNIYRLLLCRYILQGECIMITISIFKIISKRREEREEGREEGSSR